MRTRWYLAASLPRTATLVPDATATAPRVAQVVSEYQRQFRQRSVLRTENVLCLAFA